MGACGAGCVSTRTVLVGAGGEGVSSSRLYKPPSMALSCVSTGGKVNC